MKPTLKIVDLEIGYHKKTIMKGINISSSSNKLIGVIGRNGKGKSTLLKTISGLLPPIEGNVIFNGLNINTISDKKRAKLLSIVFSTTVAIENITVFDFVAYGRYPYTNWLGINTDSDKKTIKNALQLCGVNELKDRFYSELSDGERQKVNIARVIAQDTPLIVLDEPTAHLDLINKVEVLKLLKELAANHNKMIVISTHQIEMALQLCDEIWILNNNEIEINTPNELSENNKLNVLFDNENIRFNPQKQNFEIK